MPRSSPRPARGEAEQHYLDSVQNLPVYNLGFRKFTYKECKEEAEPGPGPQRAV